MTPDRPAKPGARTAKATTEKPERAAEPDKPTPPAKPERPAKPKAPTAPEKAATPKAPAKPARPAPPAKPRAPEKAAAKSAPEAAKSAAATSTSASAATPPAAGPILDDDRVIATRPCPVGHPVPITLGAARLHRPITCPTCGRKLVLKESLGQLLKGPDHPADDPARALRNIRKQ